MRQAYLNLRISKFLLIPVPEYTMSVVICFWLDSVGERAQRNLLVI